VSQLGAPTAARRALMYERRGHISIALKLATLLFLVRHGVDRVDVDAN
jgi:hypothetical protein